jgi:hypothetical protein
VGRVTGTVRDTQGRPIAGAKVRIENDFLYFDVTADSNGRYVSPSLPIGGYKAVAWANVTWEGMNYALRLGMPSAADYDFFGSEGAVRNFEWQRTGRIPDRTADGAAGYFGGALELMNGTRSRRACAASTSGFTCSATGIRDPVVPCARAGRADTRRPPASR